MAKPRYRAVIWDWNGTLIDDFQASLMTSNEILRRRGMPPITREQYYSFMGYPISKFWENLFDLEVTPMTEIGRDYYDIYPSFDCGLCDGAEDLLRRLGDAGVCQAILSSAHRDLIDEKMAEAGIAQYFDAVLTAGDLLAGSKTERGAAWLGSKPFPPRDVVVIGDTLNDFDAAREMGTDCILCAFGHQSEADLLACGVPVVREFRELGEYLFK
ncbi:MAG: HAD family hydrolase [Clostridia bacterium]|nr:HAD family hydrolase [Clostridia bacterium]